MLADERPVIDPESTAPAVECEPRAMASTLDDPMTPERCLAPTSFLDSDHPDVMAFAERTCAAAGATTDRERAVALFLAVRDGWRYDPYTSGHLDEDYRASVVLGRPSAYCIPKSVLLSAACRAAGIPARLGFADVRNHLQSEKLREKMGTDLFIYHGYSEIWVDGRWHKVSSAFNKEMCTRFGTKVLEWDGTADALMHPFDTSGNRHMEYVNQRGSFVDLPLTEILAAFDETYGAEMTEGDPVDDEAFAPTE
jgi:transglutaminase-like putative cysteine protease